MNLLYYPSTTRVQSVVYQLFAIQSYTMYVLHFSFANTKVYLLYYTSSDLAIQPCRIVHLSLAQEHSSFIKIKVKTTAGYLSSDTPDNCINSNACLSKPVPSNLSNGFPPYTSKAVSDTSRPDEWVRPGLMNDCDRLGCFRSQLFVFPPFRLTSDCPYCVPSMSSNLII